MNTESLSSCPSVSDEIINELFPEFETDPRKYYLIEKDGEMYYQ